MSTVLPHTEKHES